MDLLRRHLFFIICGLASVGGIALGVTGLNAMSGVTTEMKKPQDLYRSLSGLQSRSANLDQIAAEKRRIDVVVKDRDKVLASARGLFSNEPLVAGLFPDGTPLKRIEFRAEYARAMDKLFDSLTGGRPADSRDFSMMREKIEEEEAAAREIGLDPGSSQPVAPPAGPAKTDAGVLTESGARKDPNARAHMAAAQRIYCYTVHTRDERLPENPASLHFDEFMEDTGSIDAPAMEDVWRAQVGYWIQKDIVAAIVAVNDEAFRDAESKGEASWVNNMPVKDVISIRVSLDYVMLDSLGEAPAEPGGYLPATPPGGAEEVFTGNASAPLYEVIQSSVKLIMDQRDISRLIDRLCGNSFHTPLAVSYEVVPPNRKMIGKIYGEEPVVNVVMDIETIMLGEVFRPLMPVEVCDYYEIACPERDENDEEG